MTGDAVAVSSRLSKIASFVGHPLLAWLILGVSLFITFAAYLAAKNNAYNRAKDQFEFQANTITHIVQSRMDHYQHVLRGGVGLFYASDSVTRSEWHAYVDALDLPTRLPGVQAIGFAASVSKDGLAAYQRKVRAEGFPEYKIYPDDARDTYTAIHFIEPFDWRNQRAFGYDMYSHPLRRAAMSKAKETGKPALSGTVKLVQETNTDVQKGFLLYLPLFKQGEDEAFLGWVYAAFRARDLIEATLQEKNLNISFEIFDNGEDRFYQSPDRFGLEKNAEAPLFSMEKSFSLYGRTWRFQFSELRTPEGVAALGFDQRQPILVLLIGLLIDSLLVYVIVCLYLVNRNAKRFANSLELEYQANQESLAWQTRLIEDKEREVNVFFELAPEAFLVVNKSGEIVKANKHAHDLFKFRHSEMIGLTVESLIPKELAKQHVAHREAFQMSSHARLMGNNRKLQGLKADGSLFPVSVNLMPMQLQGEPHTVAAIHDISIQKNIEDTLAQAKENAESVSRAKSDFVANMSHEIRTPLNAVLGSAQLLEKTNPDVNQQKYIGMIKSSGEALLGVINDILDFSKIEAGRMDLNHIPFNLDDIVTRVAAMMSINIGEKQVEPLIHITPDVPRLLTGDPLRLQQVLINLVSNAIKFTSKGSVALYIRCEAQDEDEAWAKIRFEVKDTGLGIGAEQKDRLFKAFSQADASITREYGGTGLGLAISNRIANMMGSHIEVRSEAGLGSEFAFTVTLPVSLSAHQTVPLEQDAKCNESKACRALCLDLSSAACDSMQDLLASLNWQTVCFTSHDDLRAYFHDASVEKQFDMVFIDSGFATDAASLMYELYDLGLNESAILIGVFSNNFKLANLSESERALFGSSLVKPVVLHSMNSAMADARGVVSKASDSRQNLGPHSGQRKMYGMHLLLVEDNPLNQSIALALLEGFGISSIDIANNGLESIACLQDKPEHYDLILMDIQMPVMDGVSATQNIRQQLKSDIPIIAMTAGVLKSEQKSYLDAGMNDFAAKPIDERELFKVVSQFYRLDMAARENSTDKPTPASDSSIQTDAVILSDSKASLPILDTDRLDRLIDGKAERASKVTRGLQSIVEEGDAMLNKGRAALKNQDWKQAKFEFHSLKGVVANYGGVHLAHCIANLEVQIVKTDNGHQVNMGHEVEYVFEAYHRFEEAVRAWLREKGATQSNAVEPVVEAHMPLKQTQVQNVPDKLINALSQATQLQDISAIEQRTDELEMIGAEGKVLAAKIRQLLDAFDTEGIRDVLASLVRTK